MPSILIHVAAILLLIMLNGAFSMSEMAIVTARKSRLERWAKKGRRGARQALELANDPSTFLATVQIGITVSAILTGVFGGATIHNVLSQWLKEVPALEPYASVLGFGIVVVVISYLTLVFGELAPKQIGIDSAEKLACIVGPPMWWLSKIAYPAVKLLKVSSRLAVRILRIKKTKESPVTTDEIQFLFEKGTAAGIFKEAEEDMVKAVMHLGASRVTALMTPRPRLLWLNMYGGKEEILPVLAASPPQRLLVCEGQIDHLHGYVYAREALAQLVSSDRVNLRECMHQPLIVPETTPALSVLEMFKSTGTHIAVVMDEYGSVLGVVTMTDMLKSIIGEIDRSDGANKSIECVGEYSWILDGLLPIDRLKELLGVEKLPDEEQGQYHTLAGFVIREIGDVPKVLDQFEWSGYRFQVIGMRRRRIEHVGVSLIVLPGDAS